MSDELAQLDELIESDILEALGQEVPEELKNTEEITTMEIVEPDELTNIPDGLLDPVEVTKEVEVEENPQLEEEAQTDDLDDLLNSLEEDEQSSSEDKLADLLDDEPLLEETAQETQEEILEEAIDEPVIEELASETNEDISLEEEISEPALEESTNDEASEGEVLDDIGDIEILPMAEIESALEEEEEEPIQMNSSEAGSLAAVLGQLLNNKTIEITIKIKD